MQVTSAPGVRFEIYADRLSERRARLSAQRLANIYRAIAQKAGEDPANVRWYAVLFAHDPDGRIATELSARASVWTVPMQANGDPAVSQIGPMDAGFALDVLIPHEQVHALQRSLYGTPSRRLPLWFVEGQAEWLGMLTSEAYAPDAAKRARANRADNLEQADGRIDLRRWRRMPQRPPAEKGAATAENAPALSVSDAGDDALVEGASYTASDALFQYVRRQAGADAMAAWFDAVAASRDDLDSDQMAALIQRSTGVDVRADLDNISKQRR